MDAQSTRNVYGIMPFLVYVFIIRSRTLNATHGSTNSLRITLYFVGAEKTKKRQKASTESIVSEVIDDKNKNAVSLYNYLYFTVPLR